MSVSHGNRIDHCSMCYFFVQNHRSYVQFFPIFFKLKVIRLGKGIIGKLFWEGDGGEGGRKGRKDIYVYIYIYIYIYIYQFKFMK